MNIYIYFNFQAYMREQKHSALKFSSHFLDKFQSKQCNMVSEEQRESAPHSYLFFSLNPHLRVCLLILEEGAGGDIRENTDCLPSLMPLAGIKPAT